MYLTAWATLAILAVFSVTELQIPRRRAPWPVYAARDDSAPYRRVRRRHTRMLEHLPLILTPLWLCALCLNDRWAAACALLWCVGRVLYAPQHARSPQRRAAGSFLGMLACALLAGGTLWALLPA